MKTMRAKMRVTGVEKHETHQKVTFTAVSKSSSYPEDGSDEDNTFSRFTPQADASFTIANPALFDSFEAEQQFYVDFTPVMGPTSSEMSREPGSSVADERVQDGGGA